MTTGILRLIILLSGLLPVIATAQNSLDVYLKQAVNNNPLISNQKNLANSLALDSIRIKASFKPQVSFSGNGYYAPVIKGIGYDEILTNGQYLSTLLGVNYAIPGKARLDNQFKAVQLQKESLDLTTKLGVHDLRQAVTAQYISVYSGQQSLATITEILEVMQSEDKLLKALTEQSVYKETEYLAFLSTLRQQELAVTQQSLQVHSDLFTLKYICGIIDTGYYQLLVPDLKLAEPRNSEQTLPYRQFHLDSLQLRNDTEQIELSYKPKLNLFGDAGYYSSFNYQPYKNVGASIGASLVVPIYDGNQRNLQLQQFRLSEDTRIKNASYYSRQYSIKQQQLLQQIRETEHIINEAKKQLTLAETLVKTNHLLLESGDLRISDYILSISGLISAKGTIQQLEASEMQLVNQFNFLNY
jgi:outer membrane protein TolC